MKYFIVNKELATQIGVTSYRQGGDTGYVCMSGDLCGIDLKEAINNGSVRVVLASEADVFLQQQRAMKAEEAKATSSEEEPTEEEGEASSAVTPSDESENEEAAASTDSETEKTE